MSFNDTMTEAYRRFTSGDEDALGEIVRAYSDQLLYFVCPTVKNIQTAEEIVADSFVHIALKKRAFRGDSSLKSYLFAVAHNLAVDYVRKASRRGELPSEDIETVRDMTELDSRLLRDERDRHLHDAMSELCEDYRAVLYLVYFENMTADQAASVMKKSKKQTENLIFRARKALRAILEKDGYGYENI